MGTRSTKVRYYPKPWAQGHLKVNKGKNTTPNHGPKVITSTHIKHYPNHEHTIISLKWYLSWEGASSHVKSVKVSLIVMHSNCCYDEAVTLSSLRFVHGNVTDSIGLTLFGEGFI